MAGRPWHQSPVFYLLLVLVTTVLCVFHGPILHGLETWADRYFSQKGISNTLGWMTDPEAGIFESLGRGVLGILAALLLLVFAVIAWVFLYGWKLYLLVPLVGGALAWGLWFVAEPLVSKRINKKRERLSAAETPTGRNKGQGLRRSADEVEATLASRRARIEAWLSSQDREMP